MSMPRSSEVLATGSCFEADGYCDANFVCGLGCPEVSDGSGLRWSLLAFLLSLSLSPDYSSYPRWASPCVISLNSHNPAFSICLCSLLFFWPRWTCSRARRTTCRSRSTLAATTTLRPTGMRQTNGSASAAAAA